MKLVLDDTQRLNLHALMGAQRCSVDDVRFWWKLQDRIDLSDKELEAIHLTAAGHLEPELAPEAARV